MNSQKQSKSGIWCPELSGGDVKASFKLSRIAIYSWTGIWGLLQTAESMRQVKPILVGAVSVGELPLACMEKEAMVVIFCTQYQHVLEWLRQVLPSIWASLWVAAAIGLKYWILDKAELISTVCIHLGLYSLRNPFTPHEFPLLLLLLGVHEGS